MIKSIEVSMKRSLLALVAALATVCASAQTTAPVTGSAAVAAQAVTVTVPAQTVTIPAYTITVPVAASSAPVTGTATIAGAVITPTCATPQPPAQTQTVACPAGTTGMWAQSQPYVAAPYPTCWTPGTWAPTTAPAGACPAIAPPAPGNFWVYDNGAFNWAGDYSFSASINYKDTAGVPLSGKSDIAVTITGQWGGFQPYGCSAKGAPVSQCDALYSFSTKGYTKLTFALKPTIAGQTWAIYFMGVGDVNLNCSLPLSNYIATPAVGQWNTYTIPLSDLCVGGGIDIYKFAIQDQTGKASNVWYTDNIGFVP